MWERATWEIKQRRRVGEKKKPIVIEFDHIT
jgi:hypothetical protein